MNKSLLLASTAIVLTTTACAGDRHASSDAQLKYVQTKDNNARFVMDRQEIDTKIRGGAEYELKAVPMNARYNGANGGMAYPANAKPGECYAKVLTPAEFMTKEQKVMIEPSKTKYKTIAAKYDTVEQKVLVREARTEYKTIPATYKTVKEKVLVKDAYEKMVDVPAKYKTVKEKVLVKPAHTTWKKGRGPIERVDEITGEIMCLVEVPAEYKTVEKRVLVSPATTKKQMVPAEYEMVEKRVIDKPAKTVAKKIPAEYKTVSVQKLVEPERTKKIVIPAKYDMVEKRIQTAEPNLEWERILCKTNVTKDVVEQLQTALKDEGFYKGPIDGKLNKRTMNSVEQFQQAENLPQGELNIKTLEALDIMDLKKA